MRLWRHFGELSSIRRHSVRRQFALIFTGLMASTILLCWFMNNMFLEQYYVSNKTDILFAKKEKRGKCEEWVWQQSQEGARDCS